MHLKGSDERFQQTKLTGKLKIILKHMIELEHMITHMYSEANFALETKQNKNDVPNFCIWLLVITNIFT